MFILQNISMLSDRPHYKEYESLLLDVQLFVFDLTYHWEVTFHIIVLNFLGKTQDCFTYLNNLKPIKSNTRCQVLFWHQFEIIYSHWLLTFEELRHSNLNFTKLPTGRVPLHQRSASTLFMKDMKRKSTSCMNSNVLHVRI